MTTLLKLKEKIVTTLLVLLLISGYLGVGLLMAQCSHALGIEYPEIIGDGAY